MDSYLPITNPLSGKGQGELKVLLALGTQQQIMSLDTLKVISTATQIEEQNQRQMSQPAQPHQSLHQHLAYMWVLLTYGSVENLLSCVFGHTDAGPGCLI